MVALLQRSGIERQWEKKSQHQEPRGLPEEDQHKNVSMKGYGLKTTNLNHKRQQNTTRDPLLKAEGAGTKIVTAKLSSSILLKQAGMPLFTPKLHTQHTQASNKPALDATQLITYN